MVGRHSCTSGFCDAGSRGEHCSGPGGKHRPSCSSGGFIRRPGCKCSTRYPCAQRYDALKPAARAIMNGISV